MQSSTGKESAPSGSQDNPKPINSSGDSSSQGNNCPNLHLLSLINNIPPWAKLLFASALLLAVPWCRKVQRAQDLKKTVEAAVEAAEMVVEAAEKMVEAAEKVVERAEKVVEEVAEAFPNRRLKEFAIKLEQIAAFADEKTEAAGEVLQ